LIRNHPDIDLVFVTGRGIETVLPLLHDPLVPTPNYIIADVGATVVDGRSLLPIAPIQSGIERKWPGQFAIRKELAAIQGLSPQEVPQQRRCSFYFDEKTDIEEVTR